MKPDDKDDDKDDDRGKKNPYDRVLLPQHR